MPRRQSSAFSGACSVQTAFQSDDDFAPSPFGSMLCCGSRGELVLAMHIRLGGLHYQLSAPKVNPF
jgi:hypothetical protein